MPKRKTRAAFRAGSEVLDEISSLLLELRTLKEEEKQRRLESERAGRAEERADVRLGIAERGEERTIAGIEEEKAGRVETAAATSAALAAPPVQTAVSKFREAKGVDAANLRVQQLGGAETPQEATAMAIQLQTDTEQALKLVGEETRRSEFIEGFGAEAESMEQYLEALKQGVAKETARDIFLGDILPAEEPEAGVLSDLQKRVSDRLKYYGTEPGIRGLVARGMIGEGKKISGRKTKERRDIFDIARDDPETFDFARKAAIFKDENLTWEQGEELLGTVFMRQLGETMTAFSTEKSPKPTEEINVANHTPAGGGEVDVDGSIEAWIQSTGATKVDDVKDIKAMAAKLGISDQELIRKLQEHFGEE